VLPFCRERDGSREPAQKNNRGPEGGRKHSAEGKLPIGVSAITKSSREKGRGVEGVREGADVDKNERIWEGAGNQKVNAEHVSGKRGKIYGEMWGINFHYSGKE